MGSLISAPAAVSLGRLKRSLVFGAVRLGDKVGCRLTGVLPLVTIGAGNSTGYGLMTASGTRGANLALSPVNAAFLCPQLARFASCFAQYRWNKLGFVYNAIGSTASAVRMVFAYSSDYLQPVIYGVTGYAGYNSLLTTQYSQCFSPWMDWSMSVPTEQVPSFVTTYSSSVAANTRQSYGGIVACVADSNPGADFTYGVLSIAFTLDLFDPLPTSTLPSVEMINGTSRIIDLDHHVEEKLGSMLSEERQLQNDARLIRTVEGPEQSSSTLPSCGNQMARVSSSAGTNPVSRR